MKGQWVDLSSRRLELEWNIGGERPNIFGTVLPDSRASILLDNLDGALDPYHPAANIDPGPGVLFEIATRLPTFDWVIQWTGWSQFGFRNIWSAEAKNRRAFMIGVGALGRIEKWKDELFVYAVGVLRTDQMLNLMLNEIGWPVERRLINAGTVSVFAHEVERLGAFTQGNSLASFSAGAKIVALAENGLIYSDHLARLVFENFRLRPDEATALGPNVLRLGEGPGAVPLIGGSSAGYADAIVNHIIGQQDSYDHVGENTHIEVEGGYPQTAIIPRNSRGTGILLRLREPAMGRVGPSFVQGAWNIAHTYSLMGGTVRVDSGQTHARILADNLTNQEHILTVTGATGSVFQRKRSAVIAQRSGDSYDHYGPSVVVLPGNAVTDITDYRNSAARLLDIHDGFALDADGNQVADILRRIAPAVRVDGPSGIADSVLNLARVSRLVQVQEPNLGIPVVTSFFIDGVHHIVRENDHHEITLHLFDARAYSALTLPPGVSSPLPSPPVIPLPLPPEPPLGPFDGNILWFEAVFAATTNTVPMFDDAEGYGLQSIYPDSSWSPTSYEYDDHQYTITTFQWGDPYGNPGREGNGRRILDHGLSIEGMNHSTLDETHPFQPNQLPTPDFEVIINGISYGTTERLFWSTANDFGGTIREGRIRGIEGVSQRLDAEVPLGLRLLVGFRIINSPGGAQTHTTLMTIGQASGETGYRRGIIGSIAEASYGRNGVTNALTELVYVDTPAPAARIELDWALDRPDRIRLIDGDQTLELQFGGRTLQSHWYPITTPSLTDLETWLTARVNTTVTLEIVFDG